MTRLSGWVLLVGGAIAALGLYFWEHNSAKIPGAIGSLPNNPNLPATAAGQLGYQPLTTSANSALGLTPTGNGAGLQVTSLTLDPDSDEGSSPTARGQTEAAYNVGPSDTGNPFGPDENQNDDVSLDQAFSF